MNFWQLLEQQQATVSSIEDYCNITEIITITTNAAIYQKWRELLQAHGQLNVVFLKSFQPDF